MPRITTTHEFNVSEVGSSRKGSAKCRVTFGDDNGDIKVDACYYMPKEYVALTLKQKAKLKTICDGCRHVPSKKKCSVNDKRIDKIGHQVTQFVTHADNDGEDLLSDESDENEKKASTKLNRSNAAITPQCSKK